MPNVDRVIVLVAIALIAFCPRTARARDRSGEVVFEPSVHEAELPKQFQLERHTFRFHQQSEPTASTAFELSTITFASPLVTAEPNNNTVSCEYFRPVSPGRHPGVIVLHILGGDFELSRLFCRALAHQGSAALFVKMPYYGPRRQPGSAARMVSLDPKETVRGMTQAVLDVRQATAWLGDQEEIDHDQLGILGISLGGITAALSATAEPRLQKVCLLLAGGDVGRVAWDATYLKGLHEHWLAAGGTKESFIEAMKAVDPVTYAANVKGRKILMLNASHDELIPRVCTESLWHAFGEPEIVWWDAGHYSAGRYLFEGLARSAAFFAAKDDTSD